MKRRLRDGAEKKTQLEADTGHAVSYETALEALHLSPAAVSRTLEALRKLKTASLDSAITGDPDGASLLDMMAAGEDVADAALGQEWHRELRSVLMAALRELPEEAQEIIIRQYFHGISFRKIASSFERARRLIKQDREAVERLQLTDAERGLLIL